ncbi:MAG: hypothetical protein JWR38_3483 [Mucilaginibacter sp.]|nr:hypothetical protein [Mucilaginibacter sp.]
MLLLLAAICIQSCKKDATTSATTTSDQILSANINGTTWIPDTVNATITYNDAAKTKTFNVVGTGTQQRVIINVKLPNSTNTNDFTLATYKVDATANTSFNYYTLQLTPAGVYDYVQVGVVEAGSGSITFSSIDTVKKLITGTYSFTAKQVNYDENGNYVSITTQQVLLGTFTNLPYTFVSN